MKKSLRRLWIEDLRANPHLQGVGALSRNGLDCCLGRLAKLCNVEQRCEMMDGTVTFYFSSTEWSGGLLTPTFNYEIGLSDEHADALAAENNSGKTFPQIADMIEQLVPVEEDSNGQS